MKFSVVVSIGPQEKEEQVLTAAKEAGAGGATILNGKCVGLKEKKIFLGLTYERSETVHIFVLERKLCTQVIKAVARILEGHGLCFAIPLEHLMGIDFKQVIQFEEKVKEEI